MSSIRNMMRLRENHKVLRALALLLALGMAFVVASCGGSGGGTATTQAAAEATTTAAAAEATTTAAAADTGGGGSADGLSGVNEFPISESKIELTMFCAPSALIESMDTNEFTKWYEEKTNVHIVWDAVPEQSRVERLNLILAADDLPDVIFGASVTKDDEMVYGPQGKFIDLTPYIEKHGYYIKEMFDAVPYVRAGITAADGKIYSLPQVNECFHCMYGDSRAWINTALREELGLEVPTTTEELRTYLKALKDAGKIPLTASKPSGNSATNMNGVVVYLANSFVYTDPADSIYIEDGVVKASYVQPEFKEALKYMHSLYEEGLIDPAAFTQTSDELKQTCENPDENLVGAAQAWYFGSLGSLEGERHKVFDELYPVTGPTGLAYTSYSPYRHSTGQYVITNKCDNPDAAMKWADFLFSDEAAVRYIECGREGIEWRAAEEGELDVWDRTAKRARIDDTSAYGETSNVHYYQMGPSFRSFEYRESWYRGEGDMYGKDAYEWRLHVYTVDATKYRPDMEHIKVYPPVYATEDDARELKRITSNIKDHRVLYVDAFVTGERDIDKEWDAYVEGFNAVELPLYLEIKQRGYDNSSFKDSIPSEGNPESPKPFEASINVIK